MHVGGEATTTARSKLKSMNQLLHRWAAGVTGCLLLFVVWNSAPAGRLTQPAELYASLPNEFEPAHGLWGDQGDGTYANPVMPGDFSDLDAIRVARTYYAISSTFQYSPGMAVMRSDDLVNWSIVGHVVPDLNRISPELNWDRMNRAGRGIWAGSIRYHKRKFWVVFGTPDEGLFLSTSAKPRGPWSPIAPLLLQPGWDDPCPFWDDDGQGYLIATHFAADADGRTYTVHLWKLSADGQHLLPETDRIIHRSDGSEANKLYKINGLYYHYFSEVRPEGRVPMMERSRSLYGPWKIRQLMHVDPATDKEPNQGGLVQIPDGRWYFVSHQGTGDWEGRAGVLLPVTWIDGWPMIGRIGSDGIGNMMWHGQKPILGFPQTSLVASDTFDEPTLKPPWEWQYQPRSGVWSLTERPGYLRLHACAPLHPGDFLSTADILTQRSMRTRRNEVTVALDLRGMQNGDEAGITHFAKAFARIGIQQTGSVRSLVYSQDGVTDSGHVIAQDSVQLRSTWDLSGVCHFSYSLDGQTFTEFGRPYRLSWANYRGDRIGVYIFNDRGDGGYVDLDFFHYSLSR